MRRRHGDIKITKITSQCHLVTKIKKSGDGKLFLGFFLEFDKVLELLGGS